MSATHRSYVFYKLLIVDEHTRTAHIRSLSIQFVDVCERKKETFEGYQSCAHFRGALSIPHQYCYHIDDSNKTTAAHHQRKMTTTKIATHVMCLSVQQDTLRFSPSFPSKRSVCLFLSLQLASTTNGEAKHCFGDTNAPSLRKMYLYNFKHV